MPSIPISSPLGYLGVFLTVLGFFLIVAGAGILNIEKISVKPGRTTWIMGILVAIIGLGMLYIETTKADGTQTAPTVAPSVQPATVQPSTTMPATPGLITSDNTLLYEQMDEKSKVMDTMPLGTKVDVLQTQGKWLFISYDRNGAHYQGWTLKQNVQISGQ